MRSLKRWLTGLILLTVLLVGLLFSFQNTATAPLDLFVVQLAEQRVSLWILLSFAVGGFSGLLIGSVALIRLKSQTLLLRRKLDKANKDLALRSHSGIGSADSDRPAKLKPGDAAAKALIKG